MKQRLQAVWKRIVEAGYKFDQVLRAEVKPSRILEVALVERSDKELDLVTYFATPVVGYAGLVELSIENSQLAKDEIIQAINTGEIIESYPDDRPMQSCLIMGLVNSRPIHVVVAYEDENEMVFVITVYEPDIKNFDDDLKTRRKK